MGEMEVLRPGWREPGDLNAAEMISIMGPSGIGKSTADEPAWLS